MLTLFKSAATSEMENKKYVNRMVKRVALS